jgi:serine/threonine/tyrosine-interacting-like protein 1
MKFFFLTSNKELDEIKTYPSEIIPGLLYLGNKKQALQQYIKKDLKLKSYVDCTTTSDNFKYFDLNC